MFCRFAYIAVNGTFLVFKSSHKYHVHFCKWCENYFAYFLMPFCQPTFKYVLLNMYVLFPVMKFKFCLAFALKMLLEYFYGLLNFLGCKCNRFNSIFQAEYEFQNSKQIEIMCQCMFSNNYDFSSESSSQRFLKIVFKNVPEKTSDFNIVFTPAHVLRTKFMKPIFLCRDS